MFDRARAANNAIRLFRDVAEQAYPGSTFDVLMFTLSDTLRAFGIAHGGALTLVMCNTTNAVDEQWSVQISSGLAIHVPNPGSALQWANQRNRDTSFGRFYCAVDTQNDRAALVYDTYIWGGFINLLLDGPHGPGTFETLARWIKGVLLTMLQGAVEESAEAVRLLGGQRFSADEDGLIALSVISSG